MIEGPNSFLQKQSYCVYNSRTIKFTDLDTIQQFLVNSQLGNHIYDLDLIFFFSVPCVSLFYDFLICFF